MKKFIDAEIDIKLLTTDEALLLEGSSENLEEIGTTEEDYGELGWGF